MTAAIVTILEVKCRTIPGRWISAHMSNDDAHEEAAKIMDQIGANLGANTASAKPWRSKLEICRDYTQDQGIVTISITEIPLSN